MITRAYNISILTQPCSPTELTLAIERKIKHLIYHFHLQQSLSNKNNTCKTVHIQNSYSLLVYFMMY